MCHLTSVWVFGLRRMRERERAAEAARPASRMSRTRACSRSTITTHEKGRTTARFGAPFLFFSGCCDCDVRTASRTRVASGKGGIFPARRFSSARIVACARRFPPHAASSTVDFDGSERRLPRFGHLAPVDVDSRPCRCRSCRKFRGSTASASRLWSSCGSAPSASCSLSNRAWPCCRRE